MTDEQRRAYEKAWRAAHREELREYSKKWRAAHQEHVNAQAREYAAKHREQRKAYYHKHYAEHRTEIRARHRAYYYANHAYWRAKGRLYKRTANLKQYGLTVAQYDAMLEQQHGVCAICQQPERMHKKGKRVRLAVDHDHTTDAVRGLLCRACNQAIAGLHHDPAILQRAIRYVQKRMT